jgi:serine/threonine protein kinase
MQNSPVAVGQTIAQKYQVEKVIGEGGMGLVVAAWHLGLQQRVAIKFVLSDSAADQEGLAERFRREARAAARIRSEHVCRVLDVGTLDTNGVPFMVMEYLEGCDLAAELARQGRLSVADATEYVLQACEALAEAHVAGIVHRDLKPANLFLARRADGSRAIKVLDFGVSKSLSESGTGQLSLTKSATLIGSPIYMSPEQLESSRDVDARTDIWALGAILYELVSGRVPFEAHSIAQLVSAVLHSEPMSFAQLGVDVPPGLGAVVLHALSKNRSQRYASVAEFSQALAPFAPAQAQVSINRVARVLGPSGRDRSAVPTTASPVVLMESVARTPPAGLTPQPVERASTATVNSPSRRWLWALVAMAPLIVGLGVLISRGSRDAAEAAIAPTAGQAPIAPASAHEPTPAGKQPTATARLPAAATQDAGTAEAEAVDPTAAAPEVVPAAHAPSTPSLPKGVDLPRVAPVAAPAKRPESSKTQRPTANPSSSGISDFGGRR